MITAARELELVIRAQAGDRAAGDELLIAHDAYIRKTSRARDNEDVLQEARLAFFEAIQTFDVTRGFRLLTYAGLRVSQKANKAKHQDRLIRLPSYQSYQTGSDKLREAADKIGKQGVASIDAPIGEDGYNLGKTMAGNDDFEGDLIRREEAERLHTAICCLGINEKRVILARLKGETLDDIAEQMEITRQGAWHLEKTAHEKLKRIMSTKIVVASMLPMVRGARWNHLELDFIKQNYSKRTVLSIAADLNRPYTSVIKTSHDLGFRKMAFTWTPERDEMLRVNRAEGWRRCAELLGITPTAVHNRVRRLGIAQQRMKAGEFEIIKVLHAEGKMAHEIGEAIGVSDEAIRYTLRRFDMEYNKRDERKRMESLSKSLARKYGTGDLSQIRRVLGKRRAKELGYPNFPFAAAVLMTAMSRFSNGASVETLARECRNIFSERGWYCAGACRKLVYAHSKWLLEHGHCSRSGGGSKAFIYSPVPPKSHTQDENLTEIAA